MYRSLLASVLIAAIVVAGCGDDDNNPGGPSDGDELTFAMYQLFTGSSGGGFCWFTTGESLEGPVHLNGDLGIDGDPWFGSNVTMGGHLTVTAGSNPTFAEGYSEGVASIALPAAADVSQSLKDQATAGGLYGPVIGNQAYYVVELGAPENGWLTMQGFDAGDNPVAPATEVELATLNGAAWFEEDVRISGVLDGQLTIGADGNIEIWDDVVYEGSSPGGGGLDPDCDDMLGLVSVGVPDGDIIIRNTVPNQTDVEIHSIMMALTGTLAAEDYQSIGPVGEIALYGGLIVEEGERIAVLSDGTITSGYHRDYHYDSRVLTQAPPFFPDGD